MAMGLLTGKVTMDRKFADTDIRCKQVVSARVGAACWPPSSRSGPIADAHNATLGQLAVAWVLAQPGITTALVGARNANQVRENARSGEVRLSPAEVQTIRDVFEKLGNLEEKTQGRDQ